MNSQLEKFTTADDTALSFEDFKSSLGPGRNKYTDKEIELMRVICDKIADVAFNDWLYSLKAP